MASKEVASAVAGKKNGKKDATSFTPPFLSSLWQYRHFIIGILLGVAWFSIQQGYPSINNLRKHFEFWSSGRHSRRDKA
jgi:hypothetical protein